MKSAAFFASLCVVTCASALASGVYKWTDSNGKVHYGDRAPGDAPVEQLSTSNIPAALQDRLRQLDPAFKITLIGGNLENGFVCGEVPASVTPGIDAAFPAALEAAGLGRVKGNNAFDDASEHFRYYRSKYDKERCPPPGRSKLSQLRTYDFRYDPDSIAAYRNAPKLR